MWNASDLRSARWPKILCCGAVCLLLISGCSKKNSDGDNAAAGQVIAHIGSDNITIQELENEFRLANIPPDKRDDAVTKRFLIELLARKYLVQQALAAKLDREPTIHLDIMRSREQVLAGATVQRNLVAKSGSIGKTEIDKYIASHPYQFNGRTIFKVDQIIIPLSSKVQSIVEATKDFKTLDQIDQKLTDMSVAHARSTGGLDSANLSDEFLKSLMAKKAEDIFFVTAGTNGTFFKVTGEQPQPFTGEEAANRARQMIRNEMLRTESKQTAEAAEAAAKFEGDYARIMSNVAPAKDDVPAKN